MGAVPLGRARCPGGLVSGAVACRTIQGPSSSSGPVGGSQAWGPVLDTTPHTWLPPWVLHGAGHSGGGRRPPPALRQAAVLDPGGPARWARPLQLSQEGLAMPSPGCLVALSLSDLSQSRGEGRGQGAVCAACSPRSPCPWAEGVGPGLGGTVCAACSPIAPVPRQRGQAWGGCVCTPCPWAEGRGLGALLPALAPDSAATGWGNSDFSTEPTPTPASAKPWVFLSEPWSLPGGGAGSWPCGPHSPCTGPCLGGWIRGPHSPCTALCGLGQLCAAPRSC